MRSRVAIVLIVAVTMTACRGTGRLGEYRYAGQTTAVTFGGSPRPEVFTGPIFVDPPTTALGVIVRAGSRIAKEVEASRARARLDSAAARADVAGRMAARTLERASLHLRSRPVEKPDDADFILEVFVREYGIDADNWDAAAHFFIDADMYLIDGREGIQIWKARVRSRDAITPAIFGPGTAVRDAVSAAAMASVSVDEMARALERLADYSADRITGELRAALEKAQRRE